MLSAAWKGTKDLPSGSRSHPQARADSRGCSSMSEDGTFPLVAIPGWCTSLLILLRFYCIP